MLFNNPQSKEEIKREMRKYFEQNKNKNMAVRIYGKVLKQ